LPLTDGVKKVIFNITTGLHKNVQFFFAMRKCASMNFLVDISIYYYLRSVHEI